MYDLAVPPVLQALRQAQHLLAKATPEVLGARPTPDSFPYAMQFRTVAIFALRATFPLIGREAPSLPKEAGAALAAAFEAVSALTEDDFAGAEDRMISHRAGFADLTQPATEYLQTFALPNLWFHLSMAYVGLRQAGLPVGKADFDGLHSYPEGFSFSV